MKRKKNQSKMLIMMVESIEVEFNDFEIAYDSRL